MIKRLIKTNPLTYYFKDGVKMYGLHGELQGTVTDLYGNVTNIRGDVTDLYGDVTGYNRLK